VQEFFGIAATFPEGQLLAHSVLLYPETLL